MSNSLYKVEKNNSDVVNTILTNTIKMLTNRELLDSNNLDTNINNLLDNITEDMIYKITLNNEKQLILKIVPNKISAFKRSFGADTFLNKYSKNKKILVVKDIATKAEQHIRNNYPTTEIFLERELMFDIVSHYLVPKHILLPKEEAEKVIKEYNVTKKQIPKIFINDPVAKYYNMQLNDICKILRPSEKSGISIGYRLVVKGDVNK